MIRGRVTSHRPRRRIYRPLCMASVAYPFYSSAGNAKQVAHTFLLVWSGFESTNPQMTDQLRSRALQQASQLHSVLLSVDDACVTITEDGIRKSNPRLMDDAPHGRSQKTFRICLDFEFSLNLVFFNNFVGFFSYEFIWLSR